MAEPNAGRCLCGNVRFAGKGALVAVQCCHCRDCARWAGGPQMSATFTEGFDVQGPVRWFQSSAWGERGACERCGSALFWRMRDGGLMNAAVGAFDDQALFARIDEHIYVDSKPAYYEFADHAPRLTAEQTLAKYAP